MLSLSSRRLRAISKVLAMFLSISSSLSRAKRDLHSSYAPLAENPAWRLVWAMNTIKGVDEKIMIKGWYDDIVPCSPIQSRLMNKIKFNGPGLLKEWGLKSFPRAK